MPEIDAREQLPAAQSSAIGTVYAAQSAIEVQDASFAWDGRKDEDKVQETSFKLTVPEFNVSAGHLCAVVGRIGSGKTSLLHALLGEMPKHAGNVVVRGRVAYAGQQPWLESSTVRDNILL